MVVVIYYHSLTGHVALSLTGLGKEKNIHISIYPGNKKSKAYFRLHGLKFDGPESATDIVVLPSEESCGYGLSETAIYDWWKDTFDPNNEYYRLFGSNCASLVYRALYVSQEKSASLNHTRIEDKTWFATPGNIIAYAKRIGKHLLSNHKAMDQVYLKCAELKTYCHFEKMDIPYHQAMALFVRLKQFNSEEYCLLVNKPFCEGIIKAIKAFHTTLEEKNKTDIKKSLVDIIPPNEKGSAPLTAWDHFLARTDVTGLSGVDIEVHFNKLRELADFIYTLPNKIEKILVVLFQDLIKKELLLAVHQYLDHIDIQHIKEQERVKEIFDVLGRKIEDDNNPHLAKITKVDDIPYCYLGLT
jgi:hypothetical protein